MAVDPATSPDREQPAPSTEYAQPFDAVEVAAEPTEGGSTRSIVLQPWTSAFGATYVAWSVGAEIGRLGVYDPTRKRVWLGSSGYPEGNGRYRYFVNLRDSNDRLYEQVWRGYSKNQSPRIGAREGSVDSWESSVGTYTPRHPAPRDAAVTGDLHPFELYWWGPTTTGLFQVWRPISSGAVYVAVIFGQHFSEYSVYNGEFSVYFGRTGVPKACYLVYPESEDTFDGLIADIELLYESVPESGFEVTG